MPLQPVRLQTRLMPNAMHGILADAQRRRQLTAAPVRRLVGGRLARRSQNPRPQSGRKHERLLPRVCRVQSLQSCGQETLLPAADGRSRGSQAMLDRAVGCPFCQHQDQPGAKDIARRQRTGLSDAAEFQLLFFGKQNGVADHISLDVTAAANVYLATDH